MRTGDHAWHPALLSRPRHGVGSSCWRGAAGAPAGAEHDGKSRSAPAPPCPYCDNFAAPKTPAEEYSSERRGGWLTPSLAELPVQPPSPRSAPPRRFPRPVRRVFVGYRSGSGASVGLVGGGAPTARAAAPAGPNRHSGCGVLSLMSEAGSPRAAAGSALRTFQLGPSTCQPLRGHRLLVVTPRREEGPCST